MVQVSIGHAKAILPAHFAVATGAQANTPQSLLIFLRMKGTSTAYLPIPSCLRGCCQGGSATPMGSDLDDTEAQPVRGNLHVMQDDL